MPGLQKCVSVCARFCEEGVYLVSAWKEGAPIQAAKILPRNLSGIVMFRQLHCDKIHSFHSATSFLLVTIVSLMPNWRRCLISTEWVKRCRCPEPQNHMLRVKGPRPHKAQLLRLWCGPISCRRLKRVGEEYTQAPTAWKPLEGPTDNGNRWRAGQGLTKGGTSQEETQRHFLLFFHHRHGHFHHPCRHFYCHCPHLSSLYSHQEHPENNCLTICLVITKHY